MPSSAFDYLTSLSAIRDQAKIVYKVGQDQQLTNFDFDESRLGETADFVTSIILESYPLEQLQSIPPHGRWQHFEVGGFPRVAQLLEQWRSKDPAVDDLECCRRLVDLFIVSVLLDAGAGNDWKYVEVGTNFETQRSEGLAVASLHMYLEGAFGEQAGGDEFLSVDGAGLRGLTVETLAKGMQVGPENSMAGLEGRAELLRRLGDSLLENKGNFGSTGRPGNLVDCLLNSAPNSTTLDISALWNILQRLLLPIWPQGRQSIDGRPIGDAWPLSVLSRETSIMDQNGPSDSSHFTSSIQPFHKLTQWLTYSLTVPFTRILHKSWINMDLLTGLPEYRNGGLFVDMGVLTLKPHVLAKVQDCKHGFTVPPQEIPQQVFAANSDVVVEWRAMTVALLDRMLALVNERLARKLDAESLVAGTGPTREPLSLAQMLEAGTWKAGRVLAQKFRPETRSSPILVQSDGTLF